MPHTNALVYRQAYRALIREYRDFLIVTDTCDAAAAVGTHPSASIRKTIILHLKQGVNLEDAAHSPDSGNNVAVQAFVPLMDPVNVQKAFTHPILNAHAEIQ